MKALRLITFALLFVWASFARADVAIPALTGRVVDQTGTLTSGDIASLTQTLKNLELRKGSQVAVLIVPTTQPETIEQFSIRAADAWKIGRRKIDDGALLVIAKNDRKLRIEVGYGIEGALTDVTSRRIIDEVITPKFRTGDFAGGISAGVNRIIAVIDGEPLPAPQPEASQGGDLDLESVVQFAPFIIIGSIIAGGMLRALFGRLLGSAATGGLVGVVAWAFAGSLAVALLLFALAFVIAFLSGGLATAGPTYRGRSGGYVGGGGWGGGGGWSGGGSSGSSDSGFSGGGGSFGGGGASGSW
jgi:uncharacterized protein